MRLEKFIDSGDIDPAELAAAVFFDLAGDADPRQLVEFLVDKVGLPAEDAASLVGEQNARLETALHGLARKLEDGVEPRALSNELVEANWPRALADAVIIRTRHELSLLARTRAGRDQLLANSRRRIVSGITWIVLGLVCAAGFWFAAQGHGDYMPGPLIQFGAIFGPILYGSGQCVRGVVLWFGYHSGSREA